ncbi:hypothetical protein H6G93_17985 [Nostoc sp. FACHB-973]|nr:hypothetical protein [Nostoc sp. FACHB-973]
MKEGYFTNGKIPPQIKTRRDFLIYMAGTTVTSIAAGYLFPTVSQGRELDLETLCSLQHLRLL